MENKTFYNEILTEHNLHPYHKHKLEDANLVLEGVPYFSRTLGTTSTQHESHLLAWLLSLQRSMSKEAAE